MATSNGMAAREGHHVSGIEVLGGERGEEETGVGGRSGEVG